MVSIKKEWFIPFENQLLTQILGIIIIILIIIIVFLLIKKIITFSEKRRKMKEKKEILEIKRKEKKIMGKLTRDKSHIESKIKTLTNSSVPKKKSRKLNKKLKKSKKV